MENRTEEFRRQPPPPLAPRPLNIPTPEEVVLSNGLRVVIAESHKLPLVSYRLAFLTGDAHDPADIPGLADMLTDMLVEGTSTRTSRQLADEVERLGAKLSAGASSDSMTVAASALASYADHVLELLADVTLNPSFPEDELELSRQNSLQSLVAQRAQPSFLASERVAKIIYGSHPYSITSATPEAVMKMTREQLAAFHRATFIPNNAVLVVGGDVQRDALLKRVEELFGAWQPGTPLDVTFPAPPQRTARELHLVDRPGSAQCNIVLANSGIRRTDPDYFPVLVMHTVLGATASSRLFMNLREHKGYTYGAYTSLDARRTAGSFRATTEVRASVAGASLHEFFYEFDRIRDEDVSEEELRDAKAYLTGIFPIRLETQEGLIDQLLQMKVYGMPDDHLQRYRDRINAVTVEDVRRVARKCVRPDSTAIVIVGDVSAIYEQVEKYAPQAKIYDKAGNRKTSEAGANEDSSARETV